MNEHNLNNLLDFLLEFQQDFALGEPSILRNGNCATLIYQCNELQAHLMYLEVLNSLGLRNKMKTLNVGRLLYLYHSDYTLTIEAEIND